MTYTPELITFARDDNESSRIPRVISTIPMESFITCEYDPITQIIELPIYAQRLYLQQINDYFKANPDAINNPLTLVMPNPYISLSKTMMWSQSYKTMFKGLMLHSSPRVVQYTVKKEEVYYYLAGQLLLSDYTELFAHTYKWRVVPANEYRNLEFHFVGMNQYLNPKIITQSKFGIYKYLNQKVLFNLENQSLYIREWRRSININIVNMTSGVIPTVIVGSSPLKIIHRNGENELSLEDVDLNAQQILTEKMTDLCYNVLSRGDESVF